MRHDLSIGKQQGQEQDGDNDADSNESLDDWWIKSLIQKFTKSGSGPAILVHTIMDQPPNPAAPRIIDIP